MLPPKPKRPYRSVTEPLPRVLPIDPLHRDSITYPLPAGGNQRRVPTATLSTASNPAGHVGEKPKPVNPGAKGSLGKIAKPPLPTKANNLPLPPLRAAAPSADGSHEDHFNSWMAPYCGNPFADAGNTCTGIWSTCALYGKTHWRLQQIVADKNPQDDAWDSKKGFNSACWAQWGTSFFFMEPFGGILVGLQRSQIRGTYGIDGHLAQDMLLGICLPKCTQMQNDREVRAREGKTSLRKSKDYVAARKASRGTVNQQPEPNPQMKYAPKDPKSSESQSHQREKKSPKTQSLTVGNEDHASSSRERDETQPTLSFRILRKEDKQETSTGVSRSQISEREYDGANSVMSASYSQDEHVSDSDRIKGKRHSTHKRRSHHGQHLSGVPEERGSVRQRASSSELSSRRNSHSRASLNRLFHPQLGNDRSNFSFALPDGDEIIGAANGDAVRHSSSRVQKSLSYVHDFNDPPISKTLLEYYGMGERKSKGKQVAAADESLQTESDQHMFRGYVPIVSGAGTPQANSNDSASDHSSRRTSQIPLLDSPSLASSFRSATPQHRLQDCDSLVTSSEMTRQQSLSDCFLAISSIENPAGQHTIEDCVSITSSSGTTAPLDNGSDWSDSVSVMSHADALKIEAEAIPEVEKSSEAEQTSQYEEIPEAEVSSEAAELVTSSSKDGDTSGSAVDEGSEDTSSDTELSNDNTANDVPHTLEDCDEDLASRKPSLAQHALEDCDEDLESRKASLVQHTLEDCDEDLASRKASLAQHALEDCDEDLVPRKASFAEHILEDDASVLSSSSTLVPEHTLDEDINVSPEATTTPENTLEEDATVAKADIETSWVAHTTDSASQESLTYREPQPKNEDGSGSASIFGSSDGSVYASSNRITVPDQRRLVTSPTPAASSHAHQFIPKEETPELEKVDQGMSELSTASNEKSTSGEQQMVVSKRGASPVPSQLSATPSIAQQSLAQILAQNQSKMKKTQLDGADDTKESWFDRTDLLFTGEM